MGRRLRRRRRTTGSAGLPFASTKAGRVILHLLRILTGSVFVFSGVAKAIDPLGTVYKISDYLEAFGSFWVQLSPLAYPAAFVLIAVELMIGIQLLLMVRFKNNTVMALLFMLFMTPLTLYIAVFNPVTDCGCFGDALKISNWHTFYKNIILLVITVLLVMTREKFKSFFLPPVEYAISGLFLLLTAGFMTYSLMHLPLIDFRPYKIGVNIPEAMKIPEGAPVDEYNYSFVYAKDGVKKTFGIDALPDSTWTFVEQNSELVQKGYEPPITNFTILNSEYQDVGSEILEFKGKSYLLIMYDLSKTSLRGIQKMNEIFASRYSSNLRFFGVTASSPAEIEEFKKKNWLTFPVYTADPIFLKTLIRANPGLVVIENGTIVDKRNWRDSDKIQ